MAQQSSSLSAILRRYCGPQSSSWKTLFTNTASSPQEMRSSSLADVLKDNYSNSSVVRDVYDTLVMWMAVPKRKVTPSRKGNRSATKFTRRVPVVSQCSKCSRVFPPHVMPSSCSEDECPAFPHGQEKRGEQRPTP
ncbi:hypothetical protein M9435_004926 [Picochlorum sp. BPE23]|nr:hypothetical protein M9435_004926 [Picochlorum sp. BPE23]